VDEAVRPSFDDLEIGGAADGPHLISIRRYADSINPGKLGPRHRANCGERLVDAGARWRLPLLPGGDAPDHQERQAGERAEHPVRLRQQRERDGAIAPAMPTLIHHGERSRIANSESSFILHCMRRLAPSRKHGPVSIEDLSEGATSGRASGRI
jgi:hypothetical protein